VSHSSFPITRRALARTLGTLVALVALGVPGAMPVRAAETISLKALVAANATGPFTELIADFEKTHPGVTIEASFTGTQILTQQLEAGAPCDIFLSADLDHIAKLRDEKLVEPYRQISRLHEVIVVPKSSRAIASLRDLAKPGTKLVIGVADVPIGKYTRRIFENADRSYGGDFNKLALANVVSFEVNVKAVLQKVVLDEADAGVVYRTDVDAEALKAVRVIEIPKELNVAGKNYLAVASHAEHADLARALVDLAASPAGQAVFIRFGYDRDLSLRKRGSKTHAAGADSHHV